MAELRRSPLDTCHRELGAKMVPFGGWEMPLAYPDGTISEHMACRREAAAFDVSHLGTVHLEGPGTFDRLQTAFSNDLAKIGPGRTQYTHLLDEADASVVDDIIVWWTGEESFDVMPNASNTSQVLDAVGGIDMTATRAVIAVQGPAARAIVESVSPAAASVARNTVVTFEWAGQPAAAAGTGYTGEDGVECAVPGSVASEFWRAVVERGAVPAGLGARDTLRLEAGLPLHGHELGPGITPLQAGLGWVVGWQKPIFRGRAALAAERDRGPQRLLRGMAAEGRQPPRAGQIVTLQGRRVGEVTSGNFSPVLGRGIALALVEAGVAVGDGVIVEGRSGEIPCAIVQIPFVHRGQVAA